MTDNPSPQPRFDATEVEGKPAALVAWALYILSIPSANMLVLVGLVVAYAVRGSAQGNARAPTSRPRSRCSGRSSGGPSPCGS